MGRSHGSSSDATDQAIGGMESDDVIFYYLLGSLGTTVEQVLF